MSGKQIEVKNYQGGKSENFPIPTHFSSCVRREGILIRPMCSTSGSTVSGLINICPGKDLFSFPHSTKLKISSYETELDSGNTLIHFK